uniref:Uncharacterized protein n=1 Tax=Plectus sambesii TaxID=2011161 RepID=A0A914US84_9BILA
TGVESKFVKEQGDAIRREFATAIEGGLLEIIVPPSIWYPPNLGKIPSPLNEKPHRMYWRTKQTLDYIYLMMYCQKRGRYYMQLEDDIIAASRYVDRIREFIAHNAQKSWLMLELSSLGFIGKLFRTSDLPLLINFFLTFHKERPVDWLLDVLFDVTYCANKQNHESCRKTVLQHRILMNPPLFQHVGVQSSLSGKIQRLKEKKFINSPPQLYVPHKNNPKATLTTSLKAYKNHTLQNAYNGDTFFWALLPQPGDYIQFDFNPPTRIQS